MADYFNAKNLLPQHLLMEIMEHIPPESRSGAILYFSEDFYAKRNYEIRRAFEIYLSDPHFGSRVEIQEELANQYGLTERHVSRIVADIRPNKKTGSPPRKRYSGVRVRRSARQRSAYSA